MKKTMMIFLSVFVFCLQLSAQIVLNQSNTAFTPGLVSAKEADISGFILPLTGPDQFWDYSKMKMIGEGSWEYTAGYNKNFPDATFSDLDLIAVFIPDWWYHYDAYYQTSETGANYLGFIVKNQRYGISLTGNPTDSCNFPEQVYAYGTPSFLMPFPTTMSTSWHTRLRNVINFELTIAAYGLNKVPCQKVTNTVRSDTVTSWGKLRVPATKGPSLAYDVLMVKRMVVQKDSFYLAGAPAPQALLTAFGVSQGQTTSSGRYFFYRENARYPLLTVNFTNDKFSSLNSVYYDGNAEYDTGSGVDEKNNLADISIYPNPADEQLFIASNNNSIAFSIYNSTGKLVQKGYVLNKAIDINELSKGLYNIILKTTDQTKTIKFIKN